MSGKAKKPCKICAVAKEEGSRPISMSMQLSMLRRYLGTLALMQEEMRRHNATFNRVRNSGLPSVEYGVLIDTITERIADLHDGICFQEETVLKKAAGIMFTLIEKYEGHRGVASLERRFLKVIEKHLSGRLDDEEVD